MKRKNTNGVKIYMKGASWKTKLKFGLVRVSCADNMNAMQEMRIYEEHFTLNDTLYGQLSAINAFFHKASMV